jgi:hypothetical protein
MSRVAPKLPKSYRRAYGNESQTQNPTRRACAGAAPRAIRMPISCVCCDGICDHAGGNHAHQTHGRENGEKNVRLNGGVEPVR